MSNLIGKRVRMTEAFKKQMCGNCSPKHHEDLLDPDPELPDDGCIKCSTDHIEEFGGCEGIVIGMMDYNNCASTDPEYDIAKIGPEIEVRWQPSNLRYAYHPTQLSLVKKEESL